MTQIPEPCRIVMAVGPNATSNGTPEAPAMITRVFGSHPAGGYTVNLTIFPDNAPPRTVTSVRLVDTAEQAAALTGDRAYWPWTDQVERPEAIASR